MTGDRVVQLICGDGSVEFYDDLFKDVPAAEAQLVDDGNDAVIDAIFADIIGAASSSIRFMERADPFDCAAAYFSLIERAAFRTVNAARKQIGISAVVIPVFFNARCQQMLNFCKSV